MLIALRKTNMRTLLFIKSHIKMCCVLYQLDLVIQGDESVGLGAAAIPATVLYLNRPYNRTVWQWERQVLTNLYQGTRERH